MIPFKIFMGIAMAPKLGIKRDLGSPPPRGAKTQNFPGSNFLRAKTFRTKCAKPFLTTRLKSVLLPLTTLPKNA